MKQLNLSAFLDLQPGDVLLYGGKDIVSRLIQFRTWSDVSHVEIYAGICMSIASRNGIGVGRYLFRADGLRYVLRPIAFAQQQFAQGMDWFKTVEGQPYNWGDLFRFYLIDIHTKGFICSQFMAAFFAACKAPLFALDYPMGDICPSDAQVTPLLRVIWTYHPSIKVAPGPI
jgi:cell wall-associated NlpC family hydrolase